MKKNIICILLSALMFFSAFTTLASAETPLPFEDIDENGWYIDAVRFAYANQLFTGTSETTFSPSMTMTRAMVVTVLYRLSGEPEVSSRKIFDDVEGGTWYSDAVEWGYNNGIVKGMTETTFEPMGCITREQLAAITWRYAEFRGYTRDAYHSLGCFIDRKTISTYAEAAFHWAVGCGMISGVNPVTLSPKDSATRAQVAMILMRFVYCFDDDAANDPTPVDDVPPISEEASMIVGGDTYHLGMSLSDLITFSGEPDETLLSFRGYTWYLFGTDTYDYFFMAGIYNEKIVALYAEGAGFSYMGYEAGDIGISVNIAGLSAILMLDENDGDRFYGIMLEDAALDLEENTSRYAMGCEAKIDFHLVNAFRRYHGQPTLIWCPKAAAAARLHSADMAENNYFEHNSLDGRTPWERMAAQGVEYICAGENLSGGYESGILAHGALINSAPHRSTMLTFYYEYLGVGGTYEESSLYDYYYTEDYYA